MKFTGTFVAPEFDINEYIRRADAFFTEALKEAVRRWLTAATGRVPLWSGMARASLLHISRLVNGNIVLAPLRVKSRIPQGEILGQGELFAQFPVYTFTVSTQVEHYVIQDVRNVRATTGRGSPSAPWRSFEAGDEAFISFVRNLGLPPVNYKSKIVRKF